MPRLITEFRLSISKKQLIHLRIRASPAKNRLPISVPELLSGRVPALRKLGATVRLVGQSGNGDKWTPLMVWKSLLDVIRVIQDEQRRIAATHAESRSWCEALFVEPELLEAFEAIKLY